MTQSEKLLEALKAGATVWSLFIRATKQGGITRAGVVIHVEEPDGARWTTSRNVVNALKRKGLVRNVQRDDRTEYVLRGE